MLGAGVLERPRGMVQGGRGEEGSGWGTRVYLWQIHVDIWQNQYNIVKLKKKKKNLPANAGEVRNAGSVPESGRFLEEGIATHSNILAWRTPWSDKPEGL